MAGIGRRGFVKGATVGALAFAVGGVEVIMTAHEARARGVPFRLLDGHQGEALEALGETLVPSAREAGIAHFIDQQLSVPPTESLLQARIFNFRPPFADFYRSAIVAVDAGCNKLYGRDFVLLSAADQRAFVNLMRQNKVEADRAAGRRVYAVPRRRGRRRLRHDGRLWALGIPYMRISHRKRGGEMTNEKVDVVIVGAGASGSVYASVLAKAGKKVLLLESGPDWELTDLISSEIWGRRIKPAGAPILLEGKNPMAYAAQGGWGVGGAALHYFANFPRLLPTDFKVRSEHNRAQDWPIAYADVAPFYDKVAREIGVSGDAKAEEKWRPAGEAYPMPPKCFCSSDIWIKALKPGHPMVPARSRELGNSTDAST